MHQHNSSTEKSNNDTTLEFSLLKNGDASIVVPTTPLPKQFVLSMKTLFDILDDERCGFVKFKDIEKGWQDERCIELLRQVTPSSGLLTFECFCAGLRLCLNPLNGLRPKAVPLDNTSGWTAVNAQHSPPPPPKPPRAAVTKLLPQPPSSAELKSTPPSTQNKAEIRNALQHWQMTTLLNEMDKQNSRPKTTAYQFPCRMRGRADGGSSSSATESPSSVADQPPSTSPAKKIQIKRRDMRRHTLQNSLDYNVMVRRLKQLEEEQELLLLALDAVERAHKCYLQQSRNVQERIKYLRLMGYLDHWSEEVQQERLNFKRMRIFDVNRCLAALAESSYPLHLNLAILNKTGI